MKRYDLHVHTYYSKCSNNKPEDILRVAKERGLDGIVIMDHGTIKGALEVKRLNKDKDFDVVVGQEVNADIGEVGFYYVKKTIEPATFEDLIAVGKRQRAISVLVHPYNWYSEAVARFVPFYKVKRTSSGRNDPERLKIVDAIEILNGRCLSDRENRMARVLAWRLKKPGVGGSDAHFLNEIGNVWVEFDDKYTLREAILKKKIKVKGERGWAVANRTRSALRKML